MPRRPPRSRLGKPDHRSGPPLCVSCPSQTAGFLTSSNRNAVSQLASNALITVLQQESRRHTSAESNGTGSSDSGPASPRPVDLSHCDIPVALCCLAHGLCDASVFAACDCFVSMQTGNSNFLLSRAIPPPGGRRASGGQIAHLQRHCCCSLDLVGDQAGDH